MKAIDRRNFIKRTVTVSAMALFPPSFGFPGNEDQGQIDRWCAMMKDPVYEMLQGKPDLDQILNLFPRQQGEPAFDPELIKSNVNKLKTVPEINTGYPLLDLSVKTGLAHIDATFQGDHPKYGTGTYSQTEHDGFPPVIISAVDALSAWGMNNRAAQLFHYWLKNFVKPDGTFNYYGPSISEYGQILNTAAILEERAGGDGWWEEGFSKLNLISEYLLRLESSALKEDGLISGIPEADTLEQVAKYFHNNAWVVKGLKQWARLCEKTRSTPNTSIETIWNITQKLKQDTLSAIWARWPTESSDWWLPARLGNITRPHYMTDGTEASYTNYRYWPELLSSGILPVDLANRVVDARLNGGGQFCGMTRFLDHMDDWPLTEYLYALWALGRKDDFLMSLFGHISYHQCQGHLTAYEQFNFPGDPRGSKSADYCMPCQLVAARAGRLINKS